MPSPALRFSVGLTLCFVTACGGAASTSRAGETPRAAADVTNRLPTGVRLDPAATQHRVGQMPLAMVDAPEGDRVVLLLNGWRDAGIQVVERGTGRVLQTLPLPAAFLGLAFSPDGRALYASGGNGDVVYRFDWRDGSAALRDSVVLAQRARPRADGVRYPAGLAFSRDGRWLYVAENLADSMAVVDVASGRVVQRVATDRYPYGVAVAPDGSVYVSNWGGWHVSSFAPDSAGALRSTGRLFVGRHPSA
ncbi:MAG TPA: YncE family protein, partial [Gemmatimonadaceae bacterium]|nr:YncE family protein [Gemmatimonadaceae bacterium]